MPRRSLAVSLSLAALAACTDRAPTALARAPSAARTAEAPQGGKPVRFSVPTGPVTIPAEFGCGFDVLIEPVASRLYTKRFPADKTGDVVEITTGTAVLRLTNAATGESITVNVSGPGKWISHADGTFTSEQAGPWLWVAVTLLPGGSQLYLQAGRAVVEFAADFTPTIVSRVGHTVDLCAALS